MCDASVQLQQARREDRYHAQTYRADEERKINHHLASSVGNHRWISFPGKTYRSITQGYSHYSTFATTTMSASCRENREAKRRARNH
jgi:hypothetical protein